MYESIESTDLAKIDDMRVSPSPKRLGLMDVDNYYNILKPRLLNLILTGTFNFDSYVPFSFFNCAVFFLHY